MTLYSLLRPFVVLIIFTFFFLALIFQQIAFAVTPSLDKKPTVITIIAKSELRSEKLIYPARVESKIFSSVTAEAEGLVKKIVSPIGSNVRKGDVVVILENQDPVYTFASISVRAPATGIVSHMNLSLMAKISRGDKLFTITDPRSLKIIAEVPAADVGSLKIGNIGTFQMQIDSKQIQNVKITGINPFVDPKTGTATAIIEFVDKDKALAPVGVLGQVTFSTQARNVILIPDSAVTYKEGKPNVRLVANGKMTKRPIELGAQLNDSFEVTSGLIDGENIILRSNRFIKEGEEVVTEKPADKVESK